MRTTGNETGEVCHVDPQASANLVRNLTHCFEINHAWVSRATSDQHAWLVLFRQIFDLVVINQAILLANTIVNRLEPLTRQVDFRAMAQVTTVVQAHAQEFFAWFHGCQHNGLVRLRATVGLDVRIGCTEQLLRAIDR